MIAVLVIIAAVVGSYYLVGSADREEITSIEECCAGFENAERSEQVKIFHQLHTQYAEYKNGEEPDPKILDKYEAKLKELKQALTPLYDEKIAENTIENVAESEDEQAIKTAKSNLESLLITIQAEDIAVDEYAGKINELTTSYVNRLAAIEAAKGISKEEAESLVRNTVLSDLRNNTDYLVDYYMNVYMSGYGATYDQAISAVNQLIDDVQSGAAIEYLDNAYADNSYSFYVDLEFTGGFFYSVNKFNKEIEVVEEH